MRDTIAQRVSTMIPIGTLRKPSRSHVSHAETGAFIRAANRKAGDEAPSARKLFGYRFASRKRVKTRI